jgi:hypothetical protein
MTKPVLSMLGVLLLTGCSSIVRPMDDMAELDSTAPSDSADVALSRDAGADVPPSLPDALPDVHPSRRTSIVRLSNFDMAFVAPFAAYAAEPSPTQPPEFVAGCRVEDVRASRLVSAGAVTIRRTDTNARIVLPRDDLRNGEYRIDPIAAIAPNTELVASATGSAEFPAFEIGCTMPQAMPAPVQPANGAMIPFRDNEQILVRWDLIHDDDSVRVVLGGSNNAALLDVAVTCEAPIRRGAVVVPVEAVRVLRDYPNSRQILVYRFRRTSRVIDSVPIEAWCSTLAPWRVTFR